MPRRPLPSVRSGLDRSTRVLGDWQAAARGPSALSRYYTRRALYRQLGRLLRQLLP